MSNLETIYSLRSSFSIIGLTGRTGAGVSVVADILSKPFNNIKNIQPLKKENLNNKKRKYNILYRYAESNWDKKIYTIVKYRDVILLHFVRNNMYDINNFFKKNPEFLIFKDTITDFFNENSDFISEIQNLKKIDKTLKEESELIALKNVFFNNKFKSLSINFNTRLKNIDTLNRVSFFQRLANNLRKNGNCFNNNDVDENYIYYIAETINRLIKAYRIDNKENTNIVIDSLRNSLEIMFFKERYSAFYMIAINSPHRRKFLNNKYNNKKLVQDLMDIDEIEYKGEEVSKGNFYYQDVQNCIQISDIYFNHNIAFGEIIEDKDYFEELKQKCLYYLTGQIIKYKSLIQHPGLVTPSAQERSMQIAYVAKENSGCLSRKVGAVITDKYFSIKSVGWNDVARGLTPCLLRNINDLKKECDLDAYSDYEKDDDKYEFKNIFTNYYSSIESNTIKGLNLSYCFKDIQNYIDSNSNQVHTRSLHAEENAMLQLSKYGGQPLKKGILFSTASPCELCSKKARQLEITEIYYIDPYPGISNWHILRDGDKETRPKFILYSGAVGSVYHKLYSPFMSYKDELALITNKRPKIDMLNKEKQVMKDKIREELEKEIIQDLANGKIKNTR